VSFADSLVARPSNLKRGCPCRMRGLQPSRSRSAGISGFTFKSDDLAALPVQDAGLGEALSVVEEGALWL